MVVGYITEHSLPDGLFPTNLAEIVSPDADPTYCVDGSTM